MPQLIIDGSGPHKELTELRDGVRDLSSRARRLGDFTTRSGIMDIPAVVHVLNNLEKVLTSMLDYVSAASAAESDS